MIQDIFPYKLNNHYDPDVKMMGDDRVICISQNRILVHAAKMKEYVLDFPKISELGENKSYQYLFSVEKEKYFLYRDDGEDCLMPDGYAYMDVKEVRHSGTSPKYRIFATLTAKHLSDWYRDTCFCGRCGQKMVHSKAERAMECESCHYISYPRIMPAVIVGVTNRDRLLITRYRSGYQHNALVAGFTEIGETLEETVEREVMEETGLRVKNIRYYKSQPWGIANDILMGFYCDVDGDSDIHMDENELKYAEWVKKDEIVLQPDDFSLTNEMMQVFKESKLK